VLVPAGSSELDKSAVLVYHRVKEHERPDMISPPSKPVEPALDRSLLVATNVVRPPRPMLAPPDRSKEGWEEVIGTIIHFLLTKEAEQLAENKEALENFMTNEAKNEAKTYLNHLIYQ
jgi:hypothetical protein